MNPRAALVFVWKELERQIRIQGEVEKINSEEAFPLLVSKAKNIVSSLGGKNSEQKKPSSRSESGFKFK